MTVEHVVYPGKAELPRTVGGGVTEHEEVTSEPPRRSHIGPNPGEVAEIRWVSSETRKQVTASRAAFAPRLAIYLYRPRALVPPNE